MAAEPRFILTARDGKDHPLVDGESTAGRAASAEVHLPSDQVSRRHARLLVESDILQVEDLGSLNGTFVNGERIASMQVLLPGDRVRFGDQELLVRAALADEEHEIRTPVTSGYSRLPQLHLPTVIIAPGEDEPTVPAPDDAPRPGVLVALSNRPLAEAVARSAAARLEGLGSKAIEVADVYAAVGEVSGGGLVLDVEALGGVVHDLVRAWRGPARRRDPVVLFGTLPDDEGIDLAARSGADAYVAHGRTSGEDARAIVDALEQALAAVERTGGRPRRV